MTNKSTVLLLAFCLTSCSTKDTAFEVSVANSSTQEIFDVTINADHSSGGSLFGFLSAGPGEKTAAGTPVDLSSRFRIKWEENETPRSCLLDLSGYHKSMARIKRFEFVYQGQDKWSVVAKDPTLDKGQIVKPQ